MEGGAKRRGGEGTIWGQQVGWGQVCVGAASNYKLKDSWVVEKASTSGLLEGVGRS